MAKQKSNLLELKKHIKEKTLCKLYLLFGEEAYGKKIYCDKLSSLVDDGGFSDFNKIVIDMKNTTIPEIDDAIESFPMMSEKKLIKFVNSGIFYKVNEEQKEYFLKRLSDIPDYDVIIFDEEKVDKRGVLYKKASTVGLCSEFCYLDEAELVTWVMGEVLREKKKISKDVSLQLVRMCDAGMSNIKNELDKLVAYCDTQITATDVSRLVSKAMGVRVFELTDNIMAKNADGALKILRDLKMINEPAFKILYLLASTFDKMLQTSLMLSEGAGYQEISSKIGIAPFIVQKYANSARGFGENYLTDRVIEIADIDLSIKNGEISDWDALEGYVINACEKV